MAHVGPMGIRGFLSRMAAPKRWQQYSPGVVIPDPVWPPYVVDRIEDTPGGGVAVLVDGIGAPVDVRVSAISGWVREGAVVVLEKGRYSVDEAATARRIRKLSR